MAQSVFTDLDFHSVSRPVNLPTPASDGDAVPKSYVDSAVEGLAWKGAARVSTQGNIDLASPGASIDGIAMASNDRVLVRSQTDASENGLYIWNGAAVAMTRSTDAASSDDLEQAVVTIEEGTDAGSSFRQSAVNFVLDTDAVTWASFGTGSPSASETTAGIAEIATQGEADAGTDDLRFITPEKLQNWAGRLRKHSAAIGDGAATQYDITHNFGTRDVKAEVYRNSGNYDTVLCDVGRQDTNTVRLTFATAPASNAFRVVVVG